MKNNYKVIGLMSGTSLDGLDIAYGIFTKKEDQWHYEIVKSQWLKYSSSWLNKLATAHKLSAPDLLALDVEYGKYLGKVVRDFVKQHALDVDFIASHGHTVFHQPSKGFTLQIGNGNAIYAVASLPVIYDFRSLDVIYGGQGAPLVPAGDKFLFADYDVCLNLGGIANASMDIDGERKAFDICFCNMGLNYLMARVGKKYDNNGELAATGEVHPGMLKQLQTVYKPLRKKRPSLGREFFDEKIKTILDQKKITLQDKLATLVESSALEITNAIAMRKGATVLCTGGGAFNAFFISRLLDHVGDDASIILPEVEVIKFKEALVFAFLGVLRVLDQPNCLKSVTGAKQDCSAGIMVGF